MKRLFFATATILAICSSVHGGDRGFSLRLAVADLESRNGAQSPWNDPMEQLTWAVNAEQGLLLRGGQPGGAAAPVFLVKVGGGRSPELIAAAFENGVKVHEDVVAEIPWPWNPPKDDTTLPLEEALGIQLGYRLSERPGDRSEE